MCLLAKYKVFLNEYIDEEAIELLEKHADITNNLEKISEIDAIILRTFPVSRKLIENAPKLKVIGKHGVGYDSIDIEAAKEHGVKVVYTPEANIQSVSELIIALMTNAARRISLSFEKGKNNQLTSIGPKNLIGYQLNKKILGLVGAGKIGLNTARIAKNGFNMKIIAFDPLISREQCEELGIEKIDNLNDLLKLSDFVSISVPLNKGTKHLINKDNLSYMKSNAILINTSRGGVVDETALYDALKENKIFAAASDVFVNEPPTGANPLLHLENFIGTPHIGANTKEAAKLVGLTIVQEVLLVLENKEPKYRVI